MNFRLSAACVVGLALIATTATAGFRDERSQELKSDAPAPAVASEKASAPQPAAKDSKASAPAKPAEPAAPKMVSLDIGKTIYSQLVGMAEAEGWRLIWDAPDFSLDHPVSVSAKFVEAIQAVIDSANLAGARLRADFYRGNNVVRVTEF
mgnify:CR=1 FL=1